MPWYKQKIFWAAVVATLGLAGTCFAFYFDAHPALKAGLTFATGLCGILEGVFVASHVTAENAETRRLLIGRFPW